MQTPQNGINFVKQFKDKEERKAESMPHTAILLILDQDGRVHVDNSEKHFNGQIRRKATEQDAMYMLERALQEFKEERIALLTTELVMQRLERKEQIAPKI